MMSCTTGACSKTSFSSIDSWPSCKSKVSSLTYYHPRRLHSSLTTSTGSQKYPPHTNQDLRQLHQRIISAPIADHHKQSLLFYILKDCRAAPSETEPSETFAAQCYLPQKYWICVQGLWEMDRLQFRVCSSSPLAHSYYLSLTNTSSTQPALESLTQPSLLPTFSTQILSTLLAHCDKDAESALLPLAYYHNASPPLSHDPALLSSFFNYLARISLASALGFLRAQPAYHHRPLLEQLVRSVLVSPGVDGETRAKRGVELVELLLDEEEERWLEEILVEGKGRNWNGAEETVMLRRIAMGRLGEGMKSRGGGQGAAGQGRRVEGVSWGALRDGLERGVGARRDVPSFEM